MTHDKKSPKLAISLTVALCALALIVAGTAIAQDSAPKWKPGMKITSDNWTEMAGFKPNLTGLENISGTKIKKSNSAQYKKYMAKGLKVLMDKYKLSIKVKDYKRMHPSQGYIAATNKYAGKPKVVNTGKNVRKRGLKGYTAGLPFPQPKSGLEVAWNYQYGYNGDDGDLHFGLQWVSASRGVEHTEEWRWSYIIRTVNRTDIEPIPAIDMYAKKNIQYASMTYALAPYDKKGFGAVYSRSVNPMDQQGHIYVPAMRRILRNTFGTRGDTWNSTDLLYEDVRGYMGYPEWMNWKILEKTTKFGPMHSKVRLGKKAVGKTFDNKNWPHWNPNFIWEPRPTYVVEVKPKLSDYPYSKQIMYIDAESYMIYYKEVYDRKGELWKVQVIAFNDSKDQDEYPPAFASSVIVDLQSEHATTFPIYKFKANTNLAPGQFTLSNLRKRGR